MPAQMYYLLATAILSTKSRAKKHNTAGNLGRKTALFRPVWFLRTVCRSQAPKGLFSVGMSRNIRGTEPPVWLTVLSP
jgi:hypothetical protein